MPEILSQNQIDALLKGLNSGEVEALTVTKSDRKIRDYDFRSPKKFTKEQLRTMDSLHENLSRAISSYLSGVLRMFCEVSVVQIEEQRYYEYSNALPDNALIGLIELRPTNSNYDEATLVMDLSTSISFFMIDRFLGGTGEGYNLDRAFTDIEVAILENVFHKFNGFIQDAWNAHIEVVTELQSIETNPRLVQVLSPDDIVVIVVLGIKIRNLTGNLNICIPALNLEEMIGNFSSKYIKSSKKLDAQREAVRKQAILGSLVNSELELKAVLDELQLELHDVLELQVNDVIALNKNVNNDISINVNNTPWFKAKLGETRLRKAVKINELI